MLLLKSAPLHHHAVAETTLLCEIPLHRECWRYLLDHYRSFVVFQLFQKRGARPLIVLKKTGVAGFRSGLSRFYFFVYIIDWHFSIRCFFYRQKQYIYFCFIIIHLLEYTLVKNVLISSVHILDKMWNNMYFY